jgi:hypothetical protein
MLDGGQDHRGSLASRTSRSDAVDLPEGPEHPLLLDVACGPVTVEDPPGGHAAPVGNIQLQPLLRLLACRASRTPAAHRAARPPPADRGFPPAAGSTFWLSASTKKWPSPVSGSSGLTWNRSPTTVNSRTSRGTRTDRHHPGRLNKARPSLWYCQNRPSSRSRRSGASRLSDHRRPDAAGLERLGCLPQQVLQPDRGLLHLASSAMGGQEHRHARPAPGSARRSRPGRRTTSMSLPTSRLRRPAGRASRPSRPAGRRRR